MRWTAINLALSRFTWWLLASTQLYIAAQNRLRSRRNHCDYTASPGTELPRKSDFPQIASLRPSTYDIDRSAQGTVIMSTTNFLSSALGDTIHAFIRGGINNFQSWPQHSGKRMLTAHTAPRACPSKFSLQLCQDSETLRECVYFYLFLYKHCFAQRHAVA